MASYELYPIKDRNRVQDYIANKLSHGLKFSKTLLNDLSVFEGEMFVIVPPEISELKVYRFDSGGIIQTGNRRETSTTQLSISPQNIVCEYVSSRFSDIPNCFFVVEDALSRVGDPYLKKLKSKYFCMADRIYHYTRTNNLTGIFQILKFVESKPSSMGLICCFDNKLSDSVNDFDISSGEFRIHGLVSGAYDDESYIVWNFATEKV